MIIGKVILCIFQKKYGTKILKTTSGWNGTRVSVVMVRCTSPLSPVAPLPSCLQAAQAEVDAVEAVIRIWPVTTLVSTLIMAWP